MCPPPPSDRVSPQLEGFIVRERRTVNDFLSRGGVHGEGLDSERGGGCAWWAAEMRVLLMLVATVLLMHVEAAMTVPSMMLQVGQQAARAAGQLLVSRVGASVLDTKLDSADLVTAADRECQEIIELAVRQHFPDHALLGEESVPPGIDAAMSALEQRQANAEWLWIIDPIDGTTNFVHGLPLCAVSIGMVHKGRRTGAVVFDPFRAEMLTAWRGEGSQLNGEPIHASEASSLREAVLCACSPHRSTAIGPAVRSIEAVMPRARSVRILGSGVLNFAWVACGRLDAIGSLSSRRGTRRRARCS
jgi:myo-inositol-1(or 4)-monophosphatase